MKDVISEEKNEKNNNEQLLLKLNILNDKFNEGNYNSQEDGLLKSNELIYEYELNSNKTYRSLMSEYSIICDFDNEDEDQDEENTKKKLFETELKCLEDKKISKLSLLIEILNKKIQYNTQTIYDLEKIGENLFPTMTHDNIMSLGKTISDILSRKNNNILKYSLYNTIINLKANKIEEDYLLVIKHNNSNFHMELLDPFINPIPIESFIFYNYKFYVYDIKHDYNKNTDDFCYWKCVIGYKEEYGNFKFDNLELNKKLENLHEFYNYRQILIGYFNFDN